MATTTTHEPTRTEHSQNGRPSIVAGNTEARPGLMTTEFWLTMLVAIAVVAISYVDDSYSVDLGGAHGIQRRQRAGVGDVGEIMLMRGAGEACDELASRRLARHARLVDRRCRRRRPRRAAR